MRPERGFTLIEASITGVILMVGVIALVQVGRATSGQISDLRRTHGQPAIVERLLHDQYEAIMAADSTVSIPQVAPLGLDGVVYQASASRDPSCDLAAGSSTIWCYQIVAQISSGSTFVNMKAGPVDAPPLRMWRRD